MPNFTQHPVTPTVQEILGVGAENFVDLAPATDNLVASPPGADVLRMITDGLFTQRAVSVANNSGVDITNLELVLKDSQGNEVVLDTVAGPIVDGVVQSLSPDIVLSLKDGDGGLYVRFAGGAATGVSARITWKDVRNLERQDTVLTTSLQSVLPAANADEIVAPYTGSVMIAQLLNFDGANTPLPSSQVTVDGVTVPLEQISPAVPANSASLAATSNEVGTALAEGDSLEFSIDAEGAAPAVLQVYYYRTNLTPVRMDQGGAY